MTFKKINRAFLMVLALALLFSCTGGRMSRNMVVYVNQDIMNISQLEILALKHYSGVTGDHYTSDQRVCFVLKNDVIPLYNRFYTLLREISPHDRGLKRVHMIYVQGAGEILNGFKAKLIGLEKKDDGLIRIANRQIEEGGKAVGEWRIKLYQLITENKSVKMKP